MAFIVHVTTGFPSHYYSQAELTATLRNVWSNDRTHRLEQFHQNLMVDGRYLALPLESYFDQQLHGFGARNDVWIQVAIDLAEQTICRLLTETGVTAESVAQLTTTTVTGLAVPSLDARLMNRIPFSPTLKRVPLFGLGCVGGAAGLARVADYLEGHPAEAAILLAVELCSLTIQPEDFSVANMIASGLFGDGAAAVLLVGDQHPLAGTGPRVVATRSCFFPDTEKVMGWDVTNTGFKIVLNAAVPDIAHTRLCPLIEAFLAEHNLCLEDVDHWIAHPGGPKVIQALEEGLELDGNALQLTRQSLTEVGNVSSASVLFILKETLAQRCSLPEDRASARSVGLMLAMGPAFCAELVLLQW